MKTYLPGLLYALLGVDETGALVYLLYLYITLSNNVWNSLLILIVVAGLLGILNILTLIIQTTVLLSDNCFSYWIKNKGNKYFFVFASMVSLVINYKFRMIVFSKLFKFNSLSAILDNVYKFRIFNIFSFFGILVEGLALYVSFMEISKYPKNTAIFYGFLDVIIVFLFNIFISILVAWK
jgi:hypothetical protein